METKKFEIAGAQSSISWTGKKVTGAHNGTIAIKTGTLNLENDKLSNGNFVIDTTSIKILDITDPATNAQFAGHLFSEDFFATDNFPEAEFNITDAEPIGHGKYKINGDLSIKGITHPVSFPADVTVTNNTIISSGKIVI